MVGYSFGAVSCTHLPGLLSLSVWMLVCSFFFSLTIILYGSFPWYSPPAHFYGKSERGRGASPELSPWGWRKAFLTRACSLFCCFCVVFKTLVACSLEFPGPVPCPMEFPLLCPTCPRAVEIYSTLSGFSLLNVGPFLRSEHLES